MKIAVISAGGLGDGLLMMILGHHIKKAGHQVFFFHPQYQLLKPLFSDIFFYPYPSTSTLEETANTFDKIVLENDHSSLAWSLFDLRKKNKIPPLHVFFVTPFPSQMEKQDYLCSRKLSMAENIKKASEFFFDLRDVSLENGFSPPFENKTKKDPQKILIHPASKDPKRNWPKKKFIELAFYLKKEGFHVTFTVSDQEAPLFDDLSIYGFPLFIAKNLIQLTEILSTSSYFIGNDSGVGHLASYLKIPTLTISGNNKRVNIWKPGWYLNQIVTTSLPIPNFKGLVFPWFDGRLRDNYWQYFISVGKVLKGFETLVETHKKSQMNS